MKIKKFAWGAFKWSTLGFDAVMVFVLGASLLALALIKLGIL